MNITNFREKVLTLNLNEAEIKRIKNLGARHFKFLVSKHTVFDSVTDENYKKVWHALNKILANEDKFHRKQTHEMRNYKGGYVDYGYLAYNGVTDDF